MQEEPAIERINNWDQKKRQSAQGLLFIWKNPMCLIPCATGCFSFIFVVGTGIVLMIFYYFTQY